MTTMQSLTLNAAIHGLVACSYWLVPSLRITGQYFAVSVPEDFRSSREGREVAKRFRWTVAAWMVAAMGLQALQPEGVMPLVSLLVMLGGSTYAMLQARKAVAPHGVEKPVVRMASLTAEENPLPGGLLGAVGPFVLLAATAVYLQLNWASLPDRFPPYYTARLNPNVWVEKSFTNVYGPLIYAFALLMVLSLTRMGIAEGSPAGDEAARRYRRLTLRSQAVGLWALGATAAYQTVARFSAQPRVSPAIGLVVVVTVSLALIWPAIRAGVTTSSAGPDVPAGAWKLGILYYNPDDPAVLVRRRFTLGYTLNFGNKLSWMFVGMLVATLGGAKWLLP
ncbi:MAG: hypothetical protein RL328_454 [Acidobacteriota bacterium]|jgi:uncharacterized membrane protein